jgi:hypothetical protein
MTELPSDLSMQPIVLLEDPRSSGPEVKSSPKPEGSNGMNHNTNENGTQPLLQLRVAIGLGGQEVILTEHDLCPSKNDQRKIADFKETPVVPAIVGKTAAPKADAKASAKIPKAKPITSLLKERKRMNRLANAEKGNAKNKNARQTAATEVVYLLVAARVKGDDSEFENDGVNRDSKFVNNAGDNADQFDNGFNITDPTDENVMGDLPASDLPAFPPLSGFGEEDGDDDRLILDDADLEELGGIPNAGNASSTLNLNNVDSDVNANGNAIDNMNLINLNAGLDNLTLGGGAGGASASGVKDATINQDPIISAVVAISVARLKALVWEKLQNLPQMPGIDYSTINPLCHLPTFDFMDVALVIQLITQFSNFKWCGKI